MQTLPLAAPVQDGPDLWRASAPRLPDDARFALLRRPTHKLTKPVLFATARDLAASLHRSRGTRSLQLVDCELPFEFDPQPRAGVSVHTLGETGDRHEFLGWCWLDGQGRQALEAALLGLQPVLAFQGEDA